jgi:hypothetical protein
VAYGPAVIYELAPIIEAFKVAESLDMVITFAFKSLSMKRLVILPKIGVLFITPSYTETIDITNSPTPTAV